ncbi:Hypothetical predicted protein [Podarcis lilfordi]|uniref:Uncharacterized protein n=1 Tax=Podarcis lilfordi TaxID=74358 RepID=A0AA35NTK5_9SAUR|nr:Hypothetical predicted protein [Podarcis lilfordi]
MGKVRGREILHLPKILGPASIFGGKDTLLEAVNPQCCLCLSLHLLDCKLSLQVVEEGRHGV